ncbi:fused MFS/spermidine synthase [Methylomonas paludis]|uniref:Fused MFS/spermidine synthase n=1 Tax=Methylomonas paludis TaxID=1173101 RepID=A0A975R9E2_9GAMM|nr:fused MFS/spermidine synthase [Methylomonas paludis]QWF70188.1 fused MFS/spermidine synthase [Methylomonas paludis]
MKKSPVNPLVLSRPVAYQTLLLFVTVSISGGAVMILELLGTRIIAPYYGVSLYVWTALISVTMIALAIGYYFGGFSADRYPQLRLVHIILIAALSTAGLPFISSPILELTNPLGMRLGAFVSALLIFSLPLTALAMVGPFAIKLAAGDLRGIGRAVGSVYAVSTAGSVAATLLLAFYLLPQFGTRAIIFYLSLLLLLLAVFLLLNDKAGFAKPWSTLPVCIAVVLTSILAANGYAAPVRPANGFKVLLQQESIYGWVRVVDDQRKGFRLLLSDSSVLSAMEIAHGYSLLGYQAILGMVPALFRPAAKQALLIGLGGGHVARDLKAKGLATDTIEIDPVVADAAVRYFNFQPTGDFMVGDARYEIKKIHKHYDFIIHDCFTGGTEPVHMLTVEMLRDLSNMLSDDGILALNYVGFTQGEGANAVTSVYKTLASLLPNIRVFVTEKSEFTDFIFLASRQPLTLDKDRPDKRITWLLDHEYAMTDTNGIIITDDYNPLESLQVRKAEAYRKIFMQRIPPELVVL